MTSNIIVTGATGFVGSNLVLSLLHRTTKTIYCLVRRQQAKSAEERLFKALSDAAEAAHQGEGLAALLAGRVKVLEGDIRYEHCGLDSARLEQLRRLGVESLWHNAASLRFEDAYKDRIIAQNLQGTLNTLALADSLGVDAFNYMSTAYVAGKASGTILEQGWPTGSEENNWYEYSKRKAEDAVLEYRGSQPFRVRIFRPSIVIGHSGSFDSCSTTGYYGFIDAVSRVETWVKDRIPQYFEHNPLRIYTPSDTTLNLVQVDLAVEEAVAIAERGQDGTFFHLTNPHNVSTQQVITAVGALFPGIDIQACSELSALNSVDAIFRSQLLFYSPYLMSDKQFVRARDAEGYDERYLLTHADLVRFGQKHLERTRQNQTTAAVKSRKALSMLTSCEITCRHGGKLRYYKIGSGPLVVLVNAYGVSLDSWRWVIEKLADQYTVVTWECRGLYNVDGLEDDFTFGVEEHGRDLLEIVQAENASSVDIVSWCSGAKPATWLASKRKDLVRSICFIAPNLSPFCHDLTTHTPWDSEISGISKTLIENPSIAEPYLAFIKSYLTNSSYMSDYTKDTSPDRITSVLGMFNKEHADLVLQPFVNVQTLRNYARTVKEFYEYDIIGLMEGLRIPLMFLVSENDSIANPKQAEIMCGKLSNSKYLSFPATSHFLVLENGREIATNLEAFLA